MFPAGLVGYRTRSEVLSSGERIRVVEIGPVDGKPVVFIPGLGCSIWDFNRTLAPVAEAGFRAIAIDVRGHGLSDKPDDDELYSTDALVRHLIDIFDTLGITQAAIVGHSMGGALAAHLALRAPDRVRALVLISPVGFGIARVADIGRALLPRWMGPVAQAGLRRAVVEAGLRLVYSSRVHVTERNVDEYWAPSQFSRFVPAMRCLLHHFRWTVFANAELERMRSPCLIIRGGCDRVVRAPRAPFTLPSMFREVIVADAGHLPHDEAPDRVNAEIIAFLRQ